MSRELKNRGYVYHLQPGTCRIVAKRVPNVPECAGLCRFVSRMHAAVIWEGAVRMADSGFCGELKRLTRFRMALADRSAD